MRKDRSVTFFHTNNFWSILIYLSSCFVLDTGQQAADKEAKKTWKGKVAKQWKKMQGTSGVTLSSYPEGGSIGKFFHY
jgi:hypothetical protein